MIRLSSLPTILCTLTCCVCALGEPYSVKGKLVQVISGKSVSEVRLGLVYPREINKYTTILEPYRDTGNPVETTSNRRGRFRFDNLERDDLIVVSLDEKWALVDRKVSINRKDGSLLDLGEIEVAEGARIYGTVFNMDYTDAMAGITVEAKVLQYDDTIVQTFESETDENGNFTISGLPAGEYEIGSAPDDGYDQLSSVFLDYEVVSSGPYAGYNISAYLNWNTETGPLEFTAKKTGLVRGRVLDASGNPVADAEVFHFHCRIDDANARTNEDGTFILRNVETERMSGLLARKGDLISAPYREEGMSSELFAELVLQEPGFISGRLIAESGVIPENDRIDVSLGIAGNSSCDFQRLDPDSSRMFQFGPLPPGDYEIGWFDFKNDIGSDKDLLVHVSPGQKITDLVLRYPSLPAKDHLGEIQGM